MAPSLRPYQCAALDATVDELGKGNNRLLLKCPTGTGKTVIVAALLEWPAIKDWLEGFPATERKMLVIAHREELLEQAARKILAANPHVSIGIEQADRYASSTNDVVLASIQTLAASGFKRLRRLLGRHTFRLVIVDEAHHAAASTYRTALSMLGFLPAADASSEENTEAATFDDVAKMSAALAGWDAQAPKDRLLIGVTATPNRSDAVGLGCVFQTLAYSYNLRDAIKDTWLVPITAWCVETDTSLDDVKTNRGEFNQRDLAEAVNKSRRNQLAVTSWQTYAGPAPGWSHGRQTLAFTVDVAHAHALAECFQAAGVRAEPLSGETPRDVRREMLRRFEAGTLQVITNCMVLTEGTDLPTASCILHAKPTKSATLYEQMTGRGLRINPGKTDCIVIDLVDVARRHSLQTAPVLYGLPPSLVLKGKGLDAAATLVEQLLEDYPSLKVEDYERLTLEQLCARAEQIDLWRIPDMGELGKHLSLTWTRIGETTYRLLYPWAGGEETLLVELDMLEHYQVTVARREKAQAPGERALWFSTGPPRVLSAGITSAQEALRLAETFVASERTTVSQLKDRRASWRIRPASRGQIQMLTRFRCPIKPGLSCGEASELIDLALARKGRK